MHRHASPLPQNYPLGTGFHPSDVPQHLLLFKVPVALRRQTTENGPKGGVGKKMRGTGGGGTQGCCKEIAQQHMPHHEASTQETDHGRYILPLPLHIAFVGQSACTPTHLQQVVDRMSIIVVARPSLKLPEVWYRLRRGGEWQLPATEGCFYTPFRSERLKKPCCSTAKKLHKVVQEKPGEFFFLEGDFLSGVKKNPPHKDG